MNNSGTVIGKGISIRGEITGAEDFFLDGVVDGNITLDENRLTVGPNGLAHADIVTGDLVIFGRVEGSVRANARAELKRGAAFTGDLIASRLLIEEGASMQGFVDLTQVMTHDLAREVTAPKKAAAVEASEKAQAGKSQTGKSQDLESITPQYSHAV